MMIAGLVENYILGKYISIDDYEEFGPVERVKDHDDYEGEWYSLHSKDDIVNLYSSSWFKTREAKDDDA